MSGFSKSYSRHHPGKYGLVLDWETTGSDFDSDISVTTSKYQGISLGLIVCELDTFKEVDSMYVEIKFDGEKYNWTDRAEQIHGISRAHLEEHGLDRDQALATVIEFLIKYWPPGFFAEQGLETQSKIMLIGHNPEFDTHFMGQLFGDFGFQIAFHHVRIDTSQLAFALSGLYRSDDVFKQFAGVDKRAAHNALEDARMTLTVIQNIKAIFDLGMAALAEGGENV